MTTRSDFSNDLTLAATAAPTDAAEARPLKSKRSHAWHASYAVLAVLTTQLLLSGCDKQTPAEPATTVTDPAVQTLPEQAPAPSAGYPADPVQAAPGMDATTPGADAGMGQTPETAPGSTGDGMSQPGTTTPQP